MDIPVLIDPAANLGERGLDTATQHEPDGPVRRDGPDVDDRRLVVPKQSLQEDPGLLLLLVGVDVYDAGLG